MILIHVTRVQIPSGLPKENGQYEMTPPSLKLWRARQGIKALLYYFGFSKNTFFGMAKGNGKLLGQKAPKMVFFIAIYTMLKV